MNASESSRSPEYSEPDHTVSDSFADGPVFHSELKRVLFEVDVPENGKQGVLDALVQSGSDATISADHPPVSRRAFLKNPGTLVGLSTCLLFAAVLAFFWVTRQPVIPLAKLSPELNLDSRFMSEFDGNFATSFPAQGGWHQKGLLNFIGQTYGLSISESVVHDAAVRFFRLSSGKTRTVYGALLQIPASRVSPLPTLTSFDPGKVEYTQLGKGNYATVKWVEADQVYVCIVFGGARELEALGRALQSTAA
ncbi:hypothetical protein [Gimesia chilikensis]|uniref:hypothetical protein n=1 Tax=Gimesia chilikensis TaxID=2605989 RepID=UPI003A94F786